MCKVAKCAFDHRVSQDFITALQLFNVFGMFWLMNFVSAFSQTVLAIAFASWYWTFHKKNVPFFALTTSVYKTVRYVVVAAAVFTDRPDRSRVVYFFLTDTIWGRSPSGR